MNQSHFEKIFWFIVGLSLFIFSYIYAVTFLSLPKENQRFVDIAFGSLLTLLSTNANYLTGGNPSPKKSATGSPGGDTITDGDSVTVTKEEA